MATSVCKMHNAWRLWWNQPKLWWLMGMPSMEIRSGGWRRVVCKTRRFSLSFMISENSNSFIFLTLLCRPSPSLYTTQLKIQILSSNFFIRGFSFLSKLESKRVDRELDQSHLRVLKTDYLIKIYLWGTHFGGPQRGQLGAYMSHKKRLLAQIIAIDMTGVNRSSVP